MKAFNLIVKILAALAAVAGVIYVVATYGEQIVAWAKNLLNCCGGCCDDTPTRTRSFFCLVPYACPPMESISGDRGQSFLWGQTWPSSVRTYLTHISRGSLGRLIWKKSSRHRPTVTPS